MVEHSEHPLVAKVAATTVAATTTANQREKFFLNRIKIARNLRWLVWFKVLSWAMLNTFISWNRILRNVPSLPCLNCILLDSRSLFHNTKIVARSMNSCCKCECISHWCNARERNQLNMVTCFDWACNWKSLHISSKKNTFIKPMIQCLVFTALLFSHLSTNIEIKHILFLAFRTLRNGFLHCVKKRSPI